MLIDSLVSILEKSGSLDSFWGHLNRGEDATLGVAHSARPFLIATRFAHRPQTTLVVVAGEENAAVFARSIAAYLGDEQVLRFPERSDFPFTSHRRSASEVAKRLEAMDALASNRAVVVVASARALVRTLAPPGASIYVPVSFSQGHELGEVAPTRAVGIVSFEDVAHALEMRGYHNTGELDGPGTFAVRGGTIDVFPGNLVYPVRLDFFGDELEEIRRIVPSTGQTISSLSNVTIYPVIEFQCREATCHQVRKKLEYPAKSNSVLRALWEHLEEGLRFDQSDALLPYIFDQVATLGDYLPSQSLSVLVEPRSLFDDMSHAYEEVCGRARGTSIAVEGLYAPPDAVSFGKACRATYVSIMRAGGKVDDQLPVKRVEVAGHHEKLFTRLQTLVEGGYTIVFSAPSFRVRQDMKLAFVDACLPITEVLDSVEKSAPAVKAPEPRNLSVHKNTAASSVERAQRTISPALNRGVVTIVDVEIPLGMIIPSARLALVSVLDLQGSGQRPTTSAIHASRPFDITEVTFPYQPGDYVVHASHGVAHFKALVRREIDGTTRDYLLLEYAQGDKLYVPVEQLDRVTRYVGPEGASPRLTRLNTADWSRALARARAATKKLAFDLIDVYTRRATVQGFRFSADSAAQREMEQAFPYQETPDQLSAIADVKADMRSSQPMDRLICGDVGFGKTEVALRAAFLATQDNKQVMVLCPTTILAQQHYTSFKERFSAFGVEVEVLSRFRTPDEQAVALEGFARGTVSVLVGTHRLLSRDVNPHDLGLIIVDEEQRFGVGHKEQLKNLRESIDVLTLSATPIPRTMQMSLSGVRDMSLILTPPDERHPVQVWVGEWDPDVVSAAIRHELARGGQLYYVSNRVRHIEEALKRVLQAAGEARVGIAHGQMTREELERVMEDFSAGELDVLVATTIIESGIDNPHTNTLIIEDSQRLGLAQMYQLKGRVGRSSTQAYAYFMFPEQVTLTEEATARLEALEEHSDLGSGMRIALRDLEIRGAGSLLGAEQSGNMSAVGFDLFAQMLSQAVSATREGNLSATEQLPAALSDMMVNIPGHTYLPDDYVGDTDERVMWYRRIASALSEQAVEEVYNELLTARPDMPPAAKNLFEKARIKAFAFEHNIKTLLVSAGKLTVEPIDVPGEKVSKLRRFGVRYLSDKRKLVLPVRYFEQEDTESLLEPIGRLLKELL